MHSQESVGSQIKVDESAPVKMYTSLRAEGKVKVPSLSETEPPLKDEPTLYDSKVPSSTQTVGPSWHLNMKASELDTSYTWLSNIGRISKHETIAGHMITRSADSAFESCPIFSDWSMDP